LREFDIALGQVYIVDPVNKQKKKHRGRKVTLLGFKYDDLHNSHRIRVMFHDSNRNGLVDLYDLNTYAGE